MSIKAISLVWERSKQSGSDLLLMLAIADYAKDDGKGAWPSMATLAKKTRMGRRNVIRRLAHLAEVGEIIVHTGEGMHGVNVYDIHLPASDSQDTRVVTPRTPDLVTPESLNPSSYPSSYPSSNRHAPTPSKDPIALPSAEAQMSILFPKMAEEHRETLQRMQDIGWKITDSQLLEAVAIWIDSSCLPMPIKGERKDWVNVVSNHLQTYGLEKLKMAYPTIVNQMRSDGLTVSRPGSVSSNLADYFARREEVKRNGKTSTQRPIDNRLDATSQALSDALARKSRGDTPRIDGSVSPLQAANTAPVP